MDSNELKKIYFFSDLDNAEMNILKTMIQIKKYDHGDVVFEEGSPGSELYIIASGKLGVNKRTVEGDQYKIVTLKEGDIFGIMSFLDGSTHDATIIADEKSTLITIEKSVFDRVSKSNSAIANKILRRLSMHLTEIVRRMNREYMDLMHMMFRKSK